MRAHVRTQVHASNLFDARAGEALLYHHGALFRVIIQRARQVVRIGYPHDGVAAIAWLGGGRDGGGGDPPLPQANRRRRRFRRNPPSGRSIRLCNRAQGAKLGNVTSKKGIVPPWSTDKATPAASAVHALCTRKKAACRAAGPRACLRLARSLASGRAP